MADAILLQILNAVQTVIAGLLLDGIGSAADIKVRKIPLNRDALKPGIFLTPLPEKIEGVTNTRDDIAYSVLVTMCQISNEDLTSDFGRLLLWRESIRKAFRDKPGYQPLAAVAEVHSVAVEPRAVVDAEAFRNQYDVSLLVVKVTTREQRGV